VAIVPRIQALIGVHAEGKVEDVAAQSPGRNDNRPNIFESGYIALLNHPLSWGEVAFGHLRLWFELQQTHQRVHGFNYFKATLGLRTRIRRCRLCECRPRLFFTLCSSIARPRTPALGSRAARALRPPTRSV